ncbi:MAG: glycogen debranching protein GlgX [Woeseiaceae bacterium]
MQVLPGSPATPGATVGADGVNFALWSGVAERVELCFFDAQRNETSVDLPACDDGVWHGFVPGCEGGQRYGFRVHGDWNPAAGLRCNPAKVLLDPYARQLEGGFDWGGNVFDAIWDKDGAATICSHDNAASVPLSVVRAPAGPRSPAPRVPWAETVVYECNLRGFTMRHPAVPEADRGRFAGMRNKEVLAYIRALGITSIEFMPLLAWIDEHHLVEKDLRNYWGYNTIGFFAPMPRLGAGDAPGELQEMIDTVHDAGLEVILDVAYNHTGEGGSGGPMLSFRGIDNLAYYQTEPGDPGSYINDTGCGNTINSDHPRVQQIILDSLRYLHTSLGFDGFRFDLATVLGRHNHGFSGTHPLLEKISTDPALASARLIAEPWDPGPGGYQLGAFPPRWAEWNDKSRDAIRTFWRGDAGSTGELAKRVHGSSDIFEGRGRPPFSSVNFVTAHDGFTLADLVTYEQRHNQANGEENRDGHQHNYSRNYGVEGETDDADILTIRRRQRLNMLATLLFSQGTPMLLAGDDFGNSQHGNNNAYAQDNETGWLDWRGLASDPEFADAVRELIWLRRESPLLRQQEYVHTSAETDGQFAWFNRAGEAKRSEEWADSRAFTVLVERGEQRAAIVINGHEFAVDVILPDITSSWRVAFSTSALPHDNCASGVLPLDSFSIALLLADQ